MSIEVTKKQGLMLSNYENKGLLHSGNLDFYIFSDIKIKPKKPKKTEDDDIYILDVTIRVTNLLEESMYFLNEKSKYDFLFSNRRPLNELRRNFLETRKKAEIFEKYYRNIKMTEELAK